MSAPLKIAVIGSGISGMSAAWLLSQSHEVTLLEGQGRLGGHSHTVDAPTVDGPMPVDMGFIVYNAANYPNLVALFEHLGVATKATDMSLAVSLDDGNLEYGGDSFASLFAQKRNLVRPRFWSMLADVLRFYREAPGHAAALDARGASLGDYLSEQHYGRAFQEDHLLPQAAAIWSASVDAIRDYPAAAFIRFFVNHGLLQIRDRPAWRTVDGGSRAYVSRLTAPFADRIRAGDPVKGVRRTPAGVFVRTASGREERFDHVVMAAHADQSLTLLDEPTPRERALIGAFSYIRNHAVLHSDESLMPRRRKTWSAWNYVGRTRHFPRTTLRSVVAGGERALCVTYWMNALQGLPRASPLFVTLNPVRAPDPAKVIRTEVFEHPMFDAAAMAAQTALWSLQGQSNTWWCGAYFGAGFHEDGLQAGLAVAEALGGVRRPWTVADESGRIVLGPPPTPLEEVA